MCPRYIPFALLVSCLGVAFAQNSVFYAPGMPQSAPRAAARRTVAGTVVNSLTGEPIRRAHVSVNGPESHSSFTGPDGRFEIPNVLEGQLFLVAQKPGYFNPAFQPSRNPAATLGPSTGDIVLKLAPEAKIRGRVLDKSGEPIENLNVQLLARELTEGRIQWQQRGQATTDDAGTYMLENLTPGVYAIHTLTHPADPIAGEPVNAATRSEVFPPTYYPQAPDRSSLQTLDLEPGQDLAADLSLSPVTAFRVMPKSAAFLISCSKRINSIPPPSSSGRASIPPMSYSRSRRAALSLARCSMRRTSRSGKLLSSCSGKELPEDPRSSHWKVSTKRILQASSAFLT